MVLWWLTDAPELSDDVKQPLDDEPAVYLSPATVWEITVKQSAGTLAEPENLPEIVVDAAFRPLPITAEHVVAAGRLPLLHRDPQIRRYDVALLPV